jgi:N-acetylmuramoyl-L-alanine amidase
LKGAIIVQADYPAAEAHFLPPDHFGYPNQNGHVAIVIHKTGGDPTPESVELSFKKSGSSVHYAIGQDGRIWQFVLESSGAGGNSPTEPGYDPFWDQYLHKFGDLNLCTLSIEHCDPKGDNSTPLTPAQKDASFKLVAYLAKKYHIAPDHIKGHNTIDPITRALCPGNYPWDDLHKFLKGEPEMFSNELCVAVFNSYFVSIGKPPPPRATGIFTEWRSQWMNGNYKGCCLSAEYPVTLPNGDPGAAQNYAGGTCVWNKKTNTPTWL